MSEGSGLERWTTWREIVAQPGIWRGWADALETLAPPVRDWLAARAHDEVWFCGAGTSAFVGEVLAAYLNRAPGLARFRAVASTDLVACPGDYLRPGVRLLVVSFGRSGNSSETLGTLDLLDAHAPEADRLHITCNRAGALATRAAPGPGEQRVLVLPPETDDAGFAMTSSFTTMLLTALAVFDPVPPDAPEALLRGLADAAPGVIDAARTLAAAEVPSRVVFLGSGPLKGAARESALKVMELAAGRIPAMWDSPLGFRHGPKSIVEADTRVLVMLSADPQTRRYDADAAHEIAAQYGARTAVRLAAERAGVTVPTVGNDAWTAVLHVLVAQVLAVTWSDRLGIRVDNPFEGQSTLTRVVAGVRLYPYERDVPTRFGAIDLGGTKIEACLFDARLETLERRRSATPDSYPALLDALVEAAGWLRTQAGGALPVGVGLPGLIDPRTGVSLTANLAATGHTLAADLSARLGQEVPVGNDCKCFALSEANGGAGEGFSTVFGLILGTGIGGGVCRDGRLVMGYNGLPGEVGHIALPAQLIAAHGLPVLPCGCGRAGCYETLASGPGLERLARHLAGVEAAPARIAAGAAAGEADMAAVFAVWLDLLAELLHTVQLTVDPDCVVLGGGLSRIEGLPARLAEAFARRHLPGVRAPAIVAARHGDASGVRGAAMLARQAWERGAR
jgi:predicted NBD/HSP70 family sugar kinase/fructoselysine-6-P-deglycase FrlB-like protein